MPEGRHSLNFTLLSSARNPKHPAEICLASFPSSALLKTGCVDCQLKLMVIYKLLGKIQSRS